MDHIQECKCVSEVSRVLEYCVNQVYSEALAYRKYIYDISHGLPLMGFPQMIQKGDGKKEQEMKGWF